MRRIMRRTSVLGLLCLFLPVIQAVASDSPEEAITQAPLAQRALQDDRLPGMALVSINNPGPETAARLLAADVMVVRDLERYLLVVAGDAEMATLNALGLDWTVVDRPIGGKTYYTVGVRQGTPIGNLEANARVLRFDGREAVIEAIPQEVEKVIGAGFEIARVFIRPIRVKAAVSLPEAPAPTAPRAALTADPLIQQMVDQVSSSTINAHVQRMQNFKTRSATTDSCQAAANWIKAKFESYGIDSVYFHHFSSTYKDNVVAVIPGAANPDKIVVIGGHYDSSTSTTNNAPGADDNATGTECVLECARILSQYQFNYTITLIAFGGEEVGLLGSDAYATEAAARGDDIIGMIAVDMIGYLASGDVMDLDIIDNTSSLWLRNLAFDVASAYVPNLPTVDGSLPSGASSDHASFWAAGYDALLFFEDTGQYSPYIHTTNDIVGVSYNSPTFAERSVKIAVGLMATLAEPFRIAIRHTPLADTEDTENPYRVLADIVAAGTLNPDSLSVYFSTGSGWTKITMSAAGSPDEYEAFIPAQYGGTFVDYYIVGEDTEGNRAVDPAGAPGTVHTFFVGTISAVFSDDFETNKGWTVGDTGDNATTGIWERCDPQGTLAQAEDDHTSAPGVNAYITQCAAGTSQGSYDVDGGKTTLLSPIFDLSSYTNARVRYYRWYSNDTGASPETDDWVVDVTEDGGTTWIRLETMRSSLRQWHFMEFKLTDYIELTSQVRFRFIASDYDPGSIVEAGLDDFSIVTYEDAASGVASGDHGIVGRISLAQNAPNPFGSGATGTGTALRFVVPAPGAKVTLRIIDVSGREVTSLLKGEKVVGSRTVTWDGANALGARVASGLYFCELQAGSERVLRKLTLVR
ncbi:MAG: M28 family peptidase [Candidatus Eisenbacteria bacterium]